VALSDGKVIGVVIMTESGAAIAPLPLKLLK